MQAPGGWGPIPGAGTANAGGAAAVSTGVWNQHVIINPVTSITCVDVPFYDDVKLPVKGTKEARVRACRSMRRASLTRLRRRARRRKRS